MGRLLTRRGWRLGCRRGRLSFVAGRALGPSQELYVLGAGSTAPAGRRPGSSWRHAVSTCGVGRQLHAASRVHAGDTSRVELSLRNRGRRQPPVLRGPRPRPAARGGPPSCSRRSPRARPTRPATASPPTGGASFAIGPLEVELTDPFGLARRTLGGMAPSRAHRLSPIDEVAPVPPDARRTTPTARRPRGRRRPGSRGRTSTPCGPTPGDDLRRVHWRRPRRRDELMVRQDEVPWQGRATVVLDNRAATPTTTTPTRPAVSAAASVVVVVPTAPGPGQGRHDQRRRLRLRHRRCSRRRNPRVPRHRQPDRARHPPGGHHDAAPHQRRRHAWWAVLGTADRPEIDAVLRLKRRTAP